MEREKKRKKRKKKRCSESVNTIFPLLMAAALSHSHSLCHSLIKECLTKLHQSFLSQTQQGQGQGQGEGSGSEWEYSWEYSAIAASLSLSPLLLNSPSPDIASLAADIVGAASLLSFPSNRLVISDSPTLNALISSLPSMAACNALLDLCSTSLGRRRLLHFSALDTLMLEFLQAETSLVPVSLYTRDDADVASIRISFPKCELPVLLVNAAALLINTCDVEQLGKIPSKLCDSFLVCLKEMWREAHRQMVNGDILRHGKGMDLYVSSITINSLAESIFRLSLNVGQFPAVMTGEMVKRGIFCFGEGEFKDFILSQWEALPFVVRKSSSVSLEVAEIFTPLIQSLCNKDKFPSVLSSTLQALTSCFPIASDELDILNFLKEVRKKLGCPLINEQDIRVLRFDSQSKREVRFFQEKLDSFCINAPQFLFADEILKCQKAYDEGYTIALRGMEFRFEKVALFANGLASIFGQPSAGANIYLTPPSSQGLARHYDDHCVFVCQIFGSKQWKIFPPNVQLPRLYDPCNIQNDEGADKSGLECYHFLLNEGDILYIPRGFPHEACSQNSRPDGSAGFSLHLTLGIEVEPPFEWEGFVHVALFSWNHTRNQCEPSLKSLSGSLDVMSIKLLHVVVGLLGDSDPTFRKACLVAAASLQSDTNSWLDSHQNTIFSNLIEKISRESRFLEALNCVEVAIQRNEDPFQRVRWLRFLDEERESSVEGEDWVRDILPLYCQHKEMAETVFNQVKSNFCSEVSYVNVVGYYKILHEKYKKARNQYMNGMLSLHCI